MSKISSRFDEEMIETIQRAAGGRSKEEVEEIEEASKALKPKTFSREKDGKEVLFSEAFWNPETIPDIPIRVFEEGDWNKHAIIRIPEPNPNWVWPREATEQFALALYCGDTTLLWGLQGTGKSDLGREWCAKFHIPFWRMSCHRETREVHFLGNASIDYDEDGRISIKQEPTILTDSLRYGGMYVEDEAFRHSAALVLQPLREKNTRTLFLPDAPGRCSEERVIKALKGKWWYVMTDNTCGLGDETGVFDAEVQDASTLDRISASIEVSYLEKSAEVDILKRACESLPMPIATLMVDYANCVRREFKDQSMMATFSVRSLLSWAEKIELLGNTRDALKLTWWNKLSNDDKSKAGDLYHQVFGEHLNNR